MKGPYMQRMCLDEFARLRSAAWQRFWVVNEGEDRPAKHLHALPPVPGGFGISKTFANLSHHASFVAGHVAILERAPRWRRRSLGSVTPAKRSIRETLFSCAFQRSTATAAGQVVQTLPQTS